MLDNPRDITVHVMGQGYDVVMKLEDETDVQLIIRIIDRLRKNQSDAAQHRTSEEK